MSQPHEPPAARRPSRNLRHDQAVVWREIRRLSGRRSGLGRRDRLEVLALELGLDVGRVGRRVDGSGDEAAQ